MAKLAIKKATTSVTLYLFIQNSSVSTGAGLTGLVYNSAGLVAYQVRPLAAAAAITLATQTVTGAFSSGGFVEVDATNMPGVYRFDIPNAVIDTGVNSVVVMLKGATNMAPVVLEIDLVAYDPQSATSLGLSQIDAAISSRMATYTQPTGFLAATFPATIASTTNITAGTITTTTNLTNLPAITANWLTATGIAAGALDGKGNWNVGKTGYTLTATTGLGNQTADINGSVGSVTGAVGSVTGLTASDVGAIKTKTDSLTFTQAGHVDANVQRINDVTIVGDGSAIPFNV